MSTEYVRGPSPKDLDDHIDLFFLCAVRGPDEDADPKRLKGIYTGFLQDFRRKRIERIKKKIIDNNRFDPIVIDQNNVIIDGLHRHRVAIDLGLSTVPVIRILKAPCSLTSGRRKGWHVWNQEGWIPFEGQMLDKLDCSLQRCQG